jgi:phosphatidylinositol alpha-mannosyltransferase
VRIGLVTEEYPPFTGPVADHVHQFAREARRLGHTVKVLTSAAPELPPAAGPRAGRPGVLHEPDVLRLGRSRPLLRRGALRRRVGGLGVADALHNALVRERLDVVHVHDPLSPVLPLLAVHQATAPLVGSFHEPLEPGLMGRLFARTVQRHLDRLDAVVVTSRATAASLPERVRGELRVISPGVDLDRMARGCRIRRWQDGRINVLCAVGLEPRGRFELVLAAALRVWRALEIRLLVLGAGPLQARYRAMVPRELDGHVVFADPPADVRPDWFATADVVFVPAASPHAVLEAMAAGRPALAADVEAHRELLQHGREGELLPASDAGAWARALVRLGREPARGVTYGERGRSGALRFAWPGVAREILNLYRSIGVRG